MLERVFKSPAGGSRIAAAMQADSRSAGGLCPPHSAARLTGLTPLTDGAWGPGLANVPEATRHRVGGAEEQRSDTAPEAADPALGHEAT